MSNLKYFSENDPLHQNAAQLSRQKAACKLNVSWIDAEKESGIINDYEVNLEYCTCQDFKMRSLPCKHMYRLAHELNILPLVGKLVNDPNCKNSLTIKSDKNAIVKEISALSLREKEIIQNSMYWYIYRDKSAVVFAKNEIPCDLLRNNFLCETYDLVSFGNHISKSILSACIKENNCKIKLNSKKTFIVEELNSKYPDILKALLGDFYVLIPSPKVLAYSRIIYNMLNKELFPDLTIELRTDK